MIFVTVYVLILVCSLFVILIEGLISLINVKYQIKYMYELTDKLHYKHTHLA